MSKSTVIFSIFSLLALLLLNSPSSVLGDDDDSPTVYEVIQEYDLPVGLLPRGVISYELDRSTGEFTVHLNGTCEFSISGYRLRYRSRVSGVVSRDRLRRLSGVQVRILFFWVNIAEVTKEGDDLDFSVGIASAEFPLDNFYESPQCGCGFDCSTRNEISTPKLMFKRLVSSS